jgi:GT2 family glycosyltransferase
MTVFISLVTYHSEADIASCLAALQQQEPIISIKLALLDNASGDGTVARVREALGIDKDRAQCGTLEVELTPLHVNLGFSGGHNLNAAAFLESPYEYFLVLNPDVELAPNALAQFVAASKRYQDRCIITPKLFRKNQEVLPQHDTVLLDAAGMELTDDLRHFDRGSNEADRFFQEEAVFGGTGACLFFPKAVLQQLLLRGTERDKDMLQIFPQLAFRYDERAPLFDEGFFAYREDADLCWRAGHLGIRTMFAPQVCGTHVRKVLPTNRRELSPVLNGLSVRNRFLLQCNNYFLETMTVSNVLRGLIVRNLLVVGGVCMKEVSSLPYLLDLLKLIPRALERRRILQQRKYKI